MRNEDFKAGIAAGMGVVHINTEIRRAYRDGISHTLLEKPEEIAPYRMFELGRDELQKVVTERLKLFNNLN